MYSSGASDKVFVLAFDYRGFGKSTGSPSEQGLLKDAEAVVEWALSTANIPPERIVLLGHSLGTAVATAMAHRYANLHAPIEFAGLVLCAGFSNAGNAFSSYSIANVLPLLAPVKMIPSLQAWFARRMRDSWKTDERLAELVRQCTKLQCVLVHAKNDLTMPWSHTEELFRVAVQAASDSASSEEEIRKSPEVVDLGEAGMQEVWRSDTVSISKLIAKHGGTCSTRPPRALVSYNSLTEQTTIP